LGYGRDLMRRTDSKPRGRAITYHESTGLISTTSLVAQVVWVGL
jgi:hypothetical protein